MQGIIVISATTGETATSGFSIDLHNGTYVITAGDVVYPAPWFALKPQNTNGIGLWMVADRLGINGNTLSVHSEIVFECGSHTIKGTIKRSDSSVAMDVLIAPERFSFSPGDTEIPFEVVFKPVDSDGLEIKRPSWAEAQRPPAAV